MPKAPYSDPIYHRKGWLGSLVDLQRESTLVISPFWHKRPVCGAPIAWALSDLCYLRNGFHVGFFDKAGLVRARGFLAETPAVTTQTPCQSVRNDDHCSRQFGVRILPDEEHREIVPDLTDLAAEVALGSMIIEWHGWYAARLVL